ncbi:MAG: tetratricopeptide repeat protein, partial [Gammaproteobacteria bacterium]
FRLSNLGRREEALSASEEAVGVYRDLAASRPDAFLPGLGMSLNNLSGDLSNLGRREEALSASEEAVGVYRDLAASRPDAFLPDLANSISVRSDLLAEIERFEDAANAAHEALTMLLPFLQRFPERFGDLARTMSADLIRYSESASVALDEELLQRVARHCQ